MRFINASEYELLSDHMFMGFLCGVVAQNFDVGLIFIDAFKKLIHNELATSEWVFKRLETISANHSVDFVISVSARPRRAAGLYQALCDLTPRLKKGAAFRGRPLLAC